MLTAIRRWPWLALFPLTALVSAVVGVYATYDALRMAREWKQTTGTVVDLEPGGKGSYFPVIAFTVDEREQQFRSNHGSNPAPYAIGERVPVLYDPTRPDHAVIDSFAGKYVGVLVGGILTIVFALAGWLAAKLMQSGEKPLKIPAPQPNDRWLTYVSLAFVLAGLICGTIATLIFLKQDEAATEWKLTTGDVLDSWSRRGTVSQSLVRYTADDGVQYTAVLTIDSWSEYEAGESVEIAYNPARPGEATIVEEIGPGFAFWLLAVLGVIFAGAGMAVYVVFRGDRRRGLQG